MRPLESWPPPTETPTTEFPARPVPQERRLPVLNIALFVLTLATTTIAGAINEGVAPADLGRDWTHGLPFSLTLMAILLAHEMGHYVAARRHGVRVTLPYFLPAPLFLLLGPVFSGPGTFGAFIRMKSAPPDRRVLFDVGASGPWAGLVIAVPAVVYGLCYSELRPIPPTFVGYEFGDSLLFKLLSYSVFGPIPYGYDIMLHPIALAGWFGFFVTMLNLLPVGQLDGGHVVYAMFGRGHRLIARLFFAFIVVVALAGWFGWVLWAALMLFVGIDHPRTINPETELDRPRRIAGWMTLAAFVVTFIPVPIGFTIGGAGPLPEELIPALIWFVPWRHASLRAERAAAWASDLPGISTS